MDCNFMKKSTPSTFFIFVYQNLLSDLLKHIDKPLFFNSISVSYEEMIGKSSNQGVQHFSFFAAEIEKKPIFLMQNIRK